MGKSFWVQNYALKFQRAREVIRAVGVGAVVVLMIVVVVQVVLDVMAVVEDAMIVGVDLEVVVGVVAEEEVDSAQVGDQVTDMEVRVDNVAIISVQGVVVVDIVRVDHRAVVVGVVDSVHEALKEADADSKLHMDYFLA